MLIGAVVSWSLIFRRFRYRPWYVLVPFFNFYIACKIARRPGWWWILLLVPVVDLVTIAIVAVTVAGRMGKSWPWGIGMILIPFPLAIFVATSKSVPTYPNDPTPHEAS